MSRRTIVWSLLGLLVAVSASAVWAVTAGRPQGTIGPGEALAYDVRPRADLFAQRSGDASDGRVRSEALTKIGAGEYHDWGYTGRGVKVAVIDEHFDGFADRIEEGELPAGLVTRRFSSDGSSTGRLRGAASLRGRSSPTRDDQAHGVACAEIVHDVAPGATLYLIQVEDLRGSLDEVFDYLHAEGVRIVSLSLSVSDESRGDGRGVLSESGTPIYDILDDARERGLLIVKSAGNDATRHYSGPFQDADQDGWNEFSRDWPGGVDEDLDLRVAKDADVEITLSWDDGRDERADPTPPQDGPSHAYHLFLYDARGRVAAEGVPSPAGAEVSRTVQPRTESISFRPSEDGDYHIRVRRTSGGSAGNPAPAHQLRLRIRGDEVVLTEHRVPEGSLGVPADSRSVIAVAAADVTTDWLAPYSSRGPTTDGRVKPDATSYTNVSVATPAYGPRGFSGTSAAAPHVAGMAALLWSMPENRHRDVEAIRELLLSFAADRGAPGKDNAWGVGILQLPPLAPALHVHRGDGTCGQRSRTVGPGTTTSPSVRSHPSDPRLAYIPVSVKRADGSPIVGLSRDAFQVDVGQTSATVVSARYVASPADGAARSAHYALEVGVPHDLPPGPHNVAVRALGTVAVAARCLAPAEGVIPVRGSSPTLDLIVAPSVPRVGDAIAVLGSLSPAAPLGQGWVPAQVVRPDGESDPLILYDDGMHGDGVAEDGVHGGLYRRTTEPGTYRIALTGAAPVTQAAGILEGRALLAFDVRDEVLDSDGDGLPDRWEEVVGLNPAVKDALKDSDADTLSNLAEYRHGAHPLHWDTDGDGLSDGSETQGHFATSPAAADSDLGGVSDGAELRGGTNPLDPSDDGQRPRAYLPLTYRANVPQFDPAHHAVTSDAVWLATPHGLVRWSRRDGRYVTFTTRDGLVHNAVQAVAIDAVGRVWVGTQGGVSVLEGSRWRSYTSADGLAHDRVRDIAIGPDGDVWFATARGVSRLAGGTWSTYTIQDGLIDNDVYAVASASGAGRVWVGTRRGVSAFDGHAWCDYTTAAGLPHPWVTDVALNAQGQPWFATWGGGLSHLTSSESTRPITPTLIGDHAGDYVTAIVEDSAETPWVLTTDGVSTRSGTDWTTYVSDHYLSEQTTFDVPISEAVHRWFGTRPMEELPPEIHVIATVGERPWYRIQNVRETELGTWVTYGDGGGSPQASAHAIVQDGDGQVWVGTAGRLLTFDGEGPLEGAWRDETSRAGLAGRRISDIVVDGHNRLWLGIDGQGVVQFDGSRWRPVDAGAAQSSLHVSALAVDGSERLWVGSAGGYVGLSVLDVDTESGAGNPWTNLRLLDDAARQPMHDLAVDSQGRLWAATEGGVLSFSQGVWTHHRVAGAAWTLAVGMDGQVWAGTVGALHTYDGRRWHTHRLPASLRTHRVTALAADGRGRIWVGTPAGVGIFDGGAWQIAAIADDLASERILAIAADGQGRIWLGTGAGVTLHIPREMGH